MTFRPFLLCSWMHVSGAWTWLLKVKIYIEEYDWFNIVFTPHLGLERYKKRMESLDDQPEDAKEPSLPSVTSFDADGMNQIFFSSAQNVVSQWCLTI